MSQKIIHFTTLHPRTDVRVRIKEVATLAQQIGMDVRLFVQDGIGDETDPDTGVRIHDTGRPERGRLRRMTIGGLKMFRAVCQARPLIAHFHDPELIPWAMLLRLRGIKIVYDVHEDLPRQIMSKHWVPKLLRWPAAKLAELIEWLAARTFDGIAAATPAVGVRFPKRKTVLVQNFPLLDEFTRIEAPAHSLRHASFGYIGGVTGIRGSFEMVRAIAVVAKSRPEVRLEIAGDFSPVDHEAELRAEPGWCYVHHHGLLDRNAVGALLGTVRAGLVLFHAEPNHVAAQPNKMFEYMAAGLPVIASDFPLWREIVEGTGCGLLVDPVRPNAIADAMQWILSHPTEAEAMGRRGQTAVHETYNWAHEWPRLIELYDKLLMSRRRPPR